MRTPLFISPCPNDTFIFHALIHGLVEREGMSFDTQFLDIDTLNTFAINHSANDECIVKVSCAILDRICATTPLTTTHTPIQDTSLLGILPMHNDDPRWHLLPSGGAFGFGNGPLIVSRRKVYPDELQHCRIAIPGINTTANRLLSLFYPTLTDRKVYLFSDIATAVMDNEVDAGVLIHEGRFTYAALGLQLVADLGVLWDQHTATTPQATMSQATPLPLGAIVCHGNHLIAEKAARIIRRSTKYALDNPRDSMDFVRSHARELSPDVILKHISYFVNNYSLDMGPSGHHAITTLLSR